MIGGGQEMDNFKEYSSYDGLGLAELVSKGEITPKELCEEAILRIEKINPKINAVVTPMFDHGRKTADGPIPDGPFFGVPFLLKDLMAAYAGVPMTSGCKAMKNFLPEHDSEIVVRFKNAGLVILGKTNTPEFGLKGVTEPELFGPLPEPLEHRPYDRRVQRRISSGSGRGYRPPGIGRGRRRVHPDSGRVLRIIRHQTLPGPKSVRPGFRPGLAGCGSGTCYHPFSKGQRRLAGPHPGHGYRRPL